MERTLNPVPWSPHPTAAYNLTRFPSHHQRNTVHGLDDLIDSKDHTSAEVSLFLLSSSNCRPSSLSLCLGCVACGRRQGALPALAFDRRGIP
ncbi:hypothetical protein C0Q70_20126 [Pomacea canaliculata]|uniref:Uncharacterized protein n=1 Tax=Pomacea canaliculata TaxID=400727 RepID=A0A2T7NEP6_POMCA|nr:hypothetical protein C0Q70_20126 [Pomacea canaliculata]